MAHALLRAASRLFATLAWKTATRCRHEWGHGTLRACATSEHWPGSWKLRKSDGRRLAGETACPTNGGAAVCEACPTGRPSAILGRLITTDSQFVGATVWFTGLSASGKTTISQVVADVLRARGYRVETLDGDVVRRNLTKGLGFSKEDRDENIRRIGFVAHLLTRNGVIAVVAAISPYREIRDEVRARIGRFVEVFVNAPVEVCEQRDPKGLYRKARAGEIKGFTGVDDPYEPPPRPEVECCTDRETVEESVAKVLRALEACGFVNGTRAPV